MNFKYVKKPKSIMKDYIALHWLVPNNELPKHLRKKIPINEIWIRDDIYENSIRMPWIRIHEETELKLMINQNKKYKDAHRFSEIIDGYW